MRGSAGTHRERDIRRVLWIVLALNIAVALAKLFYGLFSRSVAMQADGIHSLFDGASNVVGLVGLWFASRPTDRGHPYGHSKFETFAAAGIAVMLGVAGYTVGRGAIDSLQGRGDARVTVASFAIMIGTLAVNLGVTTWESRAGRRLGSEILVADARHTLSDVMVSSAVIVSLISGQARIGKGRRGAGTACGGRYRLHGVHDPPGRRTHLERCRASAGGGDRGRRRWRGRSGRLSFGANARLREPGLRGSAHPGSSRYLDRAWSRARPRGGDGAARPLQLDRRRRRPRGAGYPGT